MVPCLTRISVALLIHILLILLKNKIYMNLILIQIVLLVVITRVMLLTIPKKLKMEILLFLEWVLLLLALLNVMKVMLPLILLVLIALMVLLATLVAQLVLVKMAEHVLNFAVVMVLEKLI